MKLVQNLRRFARENKGLAALEFAIIAPLLMVPLLLGSVDLIDVMGANKRAQNAAASLMNLKRLGVLTGIAVTLAGVALGLWSWRTKDSQPFPAASAFGLPPLQLPAEAPLLLMQQF